ncbi:biliverdin-producing heme oxygenase [Thermosynechococcaceae cyanobacterium Okahandja]
MVALSLALREGTAQAHSLAENTAFMKCFVNGMVDRNTFRRFLANLYVVYRQLEHTLAQQTSEPVAAIYFPELNRTQSLEQDLAFYYGSDWQAQITPSTPARVYVSRIKEIATTDPLLLIAHSYTRYLGDLSGGQALGKIVRTNLQLPAGQGTAFYDFAQLPTPEAKKDFKQRYRQTLDALALDPATIERIVAEANFAFALNCNLMHAFEPELKATLGSETFEALQQFKPSGRPEKAPPQLARA